ncbi:hypothetical protein Scep_028300 [Stephania cephalantha]|uniref:Uncharacterized protein n=1 Tax=Stephania cephalantha TaxID=152367 RepID=A0AAP0HI10_9MAGN
MRNSVGRKVDFRPHLKGEEICDGAPLPALRAAVVASAGAAAAASSRHRCAGVAVAPSPLSRPPVDRAMPSQLQCSAVRPRRLAVPPSLKPLRRHQRRCWSAVEQLVRSRHQPRSRPASVSSLPRLLAAALGAVAAAASDSSSPDLLLSGCCRASRWDPAMVLAAIAAATAALRSVE